MRDATMRWFFWELSVLWDGRCWFLRRALACVLLVALALPVLLIVAWEARG